MNIELYTELKKDIDLRLDKASDLVQSFPKGELGLTIRSREYLVAKKNYDRIFNELRVLNKNTSNRIKREYALAKRKQSKN